MNKKKPEPPPVNPKFILDNIDRIALLTFEDKEFRNKIVDEIRILAERFLSKKPDGGGRNENGNQTRYKCPTCGRVIRSWQYNDHGAEDIVCKNCLQRIDWDDC